MSCNEAETAPIRPGYGWAITLQGEAGMFPAGATYRAECRKKPSDASALFSLTTADNELLPLGDTLLLSIPGEKTAACAAGIVGLDIVRTDVDPEAYQNIELTIQVALAYTKAVGA
jgi:hypothetical protein